MLILLFLFWIVFNGQFNLEIFIIGTIICLGLFFFMCRFMNYSIKKELFLWRRFFFLSKYFVILFIEIIKANIATMRLMLSVKNEIEPVLVRFKSPLKTNFGKVLLANSITMTPGTITVSLEGDEYVVHCLDKELTEGLVDGVFVENLLKMEQM